VSPVAPQPVRHRYIADALERWFTRHARDLPWRHGRSGYAALVSEAMLQQTQVMRVIEPFRAFMRAFPTVQALAAADEQHVLAMWRGLGYYRRARYLHGAARLIVERFGGRVPAAIGDLRSLPGVGRYTAGAIASIVFGQPEPAVDGNVRRVLARLEARHGAGSDDEWAWSRAAGLARAARKPGVVAEALMELGAMICTPARPNGGAPRCDVCPLAKWCEARHRGVQAEIPSPAARPRRSTIYLHAVIVRRGGRVRLEQRPDRGLWSRMWQPPTIESPRKLTPSRLISALAVPVDHLRRRATFEHLTTHRRLVFEVYETTTRARRGVWRDVHDLDDLPMSNAHRRALACVIGPVAGT